MPDELAYLSATEAIARFRTRELSPLELLDAVIARTEVAEPHINAFMDTYFDQARDQAKAAADAYATGSPRLLEGLPVAVKDEPRIAGQRWTQGSKLYEHEIPTESDPIAQRVLDVGGIVHARTTTPEFSMAIVTWTHIHGITRSPWNPAMTCGGSSGGSGASLAAGTSTLATGSDIGGSIRIPAAMSGVVGFKPPWGRVPEFWPWNREPYAASGPMARTVSDVALFENAISGPLLGDMYSLPPLELPTTFPPVKGMRIAVSPDLGYFDPDPEIRAALDDAASVLRDLGATVDVIDLNWTDRVLDTAITHLLFQPRAVHAGELPEERFDDLTPYIQDLVGRDPVSVEEWMMSWQYGDEMYRELQEKVFLAGYDVLVCPTLETTSIPADLGHPDSDTTTDLNEMIAMAMTYPFNVLGKLPVANVPIGMAPSTGVPIGMQIVGPPDDDPVPLRVAFGYEEAAGTFFSRHRPAFEGQASTEKT
jgi:Asp-tRNA(Asn)/Glu-tRNA(Gln) amidotransferase A subunit family amidase